MGYIKSTAIALLSAIGIAGSVSAQHSHLHSELAPQTYRLGNAVLFMSIESNKGVADGSALAIAYMADCGGSWVTSALAFEEAKDRTVASSDLQQRLLAKLTTPVLEAPQVMTWSAVTDDLLGRLRTAALDSCKRARRIPSDLLITVTTTQGVAGVASSLVAGTASRKGPVVAATVRSTDWLTRQRARDDQSLQRVEKPVIERVAQGSYRMAKLEFNCADRTERGLNLKSYDASGSMVGEFPLPSDPAFTRVTPGSQSEALMQFLCRAF